MLTRRAWLILRARGWVPTTAKGQALALFTVSSLVSLIVWLVITSTVGTTLAVIVNVALALFDCRSYSTLGERAQWRRLNASAKIGVVLVYLTAFVAPLFLLWATIRTAWRQRQAAIAARSEEIACLERQLFGEGLPPLYVPSELPPS